jgi:glycosyltransferase involved in cell wall biosynthesis
VLIAHGIEVWGKQQGLKRKALESADLILSVSNFTKRKIIENNPTVRAGKIKIIFNAIDPYFKPPKAFHKPGYLLDRYKLRADNQIVLTVTRLSSTEKYKGYDNVIRCVRQIAEVNPEIRYLLCGNADKPESERINALINDINANRLVTTTGFVSDVELVDHYLLADVFVMQSAKEGFGIVFIEALACGRKVIAGNSDGSVDALLNGTLGTLINPLSTEELNDAITDSLKAASNPHELQSKAIENFGFLSFKRRVKKLLVEDLNE